MEKHIISVVGGGGKTTIIYTMAEKYRQEGLRVAVMTTTHMMAPDEQVWARDEKQIQSLWKQNRIVVIGCDAAEEGAEGQKIVAPLQELLDYVLKEADFVLIEADGAKHLPCKVPDTHEPVIIPECDIVIGVAGMDALDKPLGKVCFRKEIAKELLGVTEEHKMTEADLATILSSEKGTRKNVGARDYYVVLNKCDDEILQKRGEKIRRLLSEKGITQVILTTHAPYHQEGER